MTQPAERYCPSCERSFHEAARCPDDGTELVVITPRADPLIGRSLGDRYTVLERLGAGGMGTVYRGTQHSVGRDVAIKVVSAPLVLEPDAIKRFLREAKLASRLSHPNAVSVLDFGQTPDGVFYLVMELLSGTTLDKVLRAESRLRLSRVARIGQQICDALEGAHRLSIVHRDLKPANVMLLDGSEGRDLVKVLDFGLAKSLSNDSTNMSVTASGALLGTPAFMSPEAATGGAVDERSDLYSLGCTLYALISGRPPFQSDKVHEMLAMHGNVAPPPLNGVPEQVAAVIMKLLAKEPTSRFRTAAATRHALEEATLPYISRDLETANANTLPGRKKSMPPILVPATAATVDATMPKAVVKPRDADDSDAMAATVTPVVAVQGAAKAVAAAETPAPMVASVVPPVAPVAAPVVPTKRSGRRVALVGVVILGAVLAVAVAKRRRNGERPQPSVTTPESSPPVPPPTPAAVVVVDAGVTETPAAVTIDAAVEVPTVKPPKQPKSVGTKIVPKVDAGAPPTVELPAKPDAGSGRTPW